MRRKVAPPAALLAIALLWASAAHAAPPKRIVALTPFAANTLVKLGVMPVGIGQTLGGQERFSPKLKGVEVLPLSHPNGPNLEQLASLDPTSSSPRGPGRRATTRWATSASGC